MPVDLLAPLRWARTGLGDQARAVLSGRDLPGPEVFATHEGNDPGLFGPDSIAWRVHADLSPVVGGLRALFLQALHPLAMAGVAEHSDYRHDPLGRLHRTGWFLAATTYGTRATAETAIESVRRIHGTVTGTAPDGRPYSANQPDLLTWVHACEVDSFLAAYQRYGPGLSGEDADQYLAEMATVAYALGAEWVPETRQELDDYFHDIRPDLGAGGEARQVARFLLVPPLPIVTRGPYAVLVAAAVGLLPGWARGMLRIPTLPGVDPLLVRPAATVLLRTVGWALGEHTIEAAETSRSAA